MNIKDDVYCFDSKEKKIFKATVVGMQISETGYELIAVMTNAGKKKFIERAHVHLSETEAQKHKERVTPIMEKLDKEVEEFTKKADAVREDVIGKPEHKDLAKKIMECKG